MSVVHDFDLVTSDQIIKTIKEELAVRRMSRQSLADAARISISTLEKTLSRHRPVTLSTVVKLEAALAIALKPQQAVDTGAEKTSQVAPSSLGSYSHASVKWIEGEYITIRPSFTESGIIFSYLTAISWEETAGHLKFWETERSDSWFEQAGDVAISNLSGHVYLVTNSDGQFRTLTLGRCARYNALMGMLSTLAQVQGAHGMPMTCPMVLVRLKDGEKPRLGKVEPSDENFTVYREMLDYALDAEFANFIR